MGTLLIASMRAVRRAVPSSRERRIAVGGLVAVLFAGAVVRGLFMAAWSPAFMGWPDAKSYVDVAHGQLFGNPLRPAGYPLFLAVLDALWTNIHFIVVVNHVLGLATAAILYATVVRAGGPRWLGLVPAAIVALGGDQIFLEHSVLSETLFTFLTAVGVYAAVRCAERTSWAWPAVAGLALACSAAVRVVGLATIVVVCAWLLIGSSGALRRRLASTAVAALGALVILSAYWIAEYSTTGAVGMSRNGDYHLYGRVAPFADCTKFTPPPGTEVLCETTPRSQRPITDAYIFSYWHSPAVRAFNNPFDATPEASAKVGAWARAVIVHQPGDYLVEVGAGMLRYVAPESEWLHGYGGGPGYQALTGRNILLNPNFQSHAIDSLQLYYGWPHPDYRKRPGLLSGLRVYERITRIQGPVFVLLALLSLAGPLLARGQQRRVVLLLSFVAWTLLTAPVASLEFSARTAVPGFGFLGAAAVLGGFALARAVRERRAARGPREPAGPSPLQPKPAG
jgi:hypothetical protein